MAELEVPAGKPSASYGASAFGRGGEIGKHTGFRS